MTRRASAAVVFTAVAAATTACTLGPGPGRATGTGRGQTVRLCAPPRTSAPELTLAVRIVASRVRGYSLRSRVGTVVGSDCVLVSLERRVSNPRALASMLAEQGRFVQGVGVPPSSTGPQFGVRVRYTTDPITSANRDTPVVRAIFESGDIRAASVRLRAGYLVRFDLKSAARRRWCRFTSTHPGVLSPGLLDRVVVDPLTVDSDTCVTSVTSLPLPSEVSRARFSRTGAMALLAYLRFGPLPFQWRRVTVGSRN